MYAWINNIQRFSIHDGPGIRTTVFFQGCNLRCRWCHNPDTIPVKPVFRYMEHRCLKCGSCVRKCEGGALQWEGRPSWRAGLCTGCGACRDACPVQAWAMTAKRMAVGEIMDIVLRDKPFYDSAVGGGLTCSGGEPALAPQFLYELLDNAKGNGVHTAVDTAAALPWEHYKTLLPVTDLFLVDYKHDDEARHFDATGAGNRLIRENLRRFVDCGAPIVVRVPIIPGFNADDTSIGDMASYLLEIGYKGQAELLKLHHLGEDKYTTLGLKYPYAGVEQPEDADMERYCGIFQKHGIGACCR